MHSKNWQRIPAFLALVAAHALLGCSGGASQNADGAASNGSTATPTDGPRELGGSDAARPSGDPNLGGLNVTLTFDGTGFVATDGGISGPPPASCTEGDSTLAYNALPFSVVNCVNFSAGFEALGLAEFGDEVQLAGSGAGIASLKAMVFISACEDRSMNGVCMSAPGATFPHPMTANIYAVDDTCAAPPCAGVRLGSVTQQMTLPFRPSADDVNCTGTNAGKWFNAAAVPTGACKSGITTVQTFTFSAPIAIPADRRVIWTVAFNTTHAGANPIGPTLCNTTAAGCPYDSINIGATSHPNAPYAGVDVDVDQAFAGVSPAGPLEVNTGWTDNRPLGAIITN